MSGAQPALPAPRLWTRQLRPSQRRAAPPAANDYRRHGAVAAARVGASGAVSTSSRSQATLGPSPALALALALAQPLALALTLALTLTLTLALVLTLTVALIP